MNEKTHQILYEKELVLENNFYNKHKRRCTWVSKLNGAKYQIIYIVMQ